MVSEVGVWGLLFREASVDGWLRVSFVTKGIPLVRRQQLPDEATLPVEAAVQEVKRDTPNLA